MATRRTKAEIEQEWRQQLVAQETAQDTQPIEEEPEETSLDRVVSFVQGVSDDGATVVRLYREDRITKRRAWCEDFTPQDFEAGGPAMIRAKWGAGRYWIAVSKKGVKGIMASSFLDIENNTAPVAVATQQQGGDLARVLEVMQANQQAFQQQLLEAMTNRPEPPDPMTQMTQMLTVMGLMREAMGFGGAQQKSSIGELVDAMKEMRAAKDMFENGDPKEEPGLMSVLPGLLETISRASQGQQPQLPAPTRPSPEVLAAMDARRRQQAQQPVAPQPPTTTEPPVNQEEENMKMTAMLELKKNFDKLLAMAVAGKDFEEGADFVYDELPDEFFLILKDPTWFDQLATYVPAAKPFKDWFTKAGELALDMVENPDTYFDAEGGPKVEAVSEAASTDSQTNQDPAP